MDVLPYFSQGYEASGGGGNLWIFPIWDWRSRTKEIYPGRVVAWERPAGLHPRDLQECILLRSPSPGQRCEFLALSFQFCSGATFQMVPIPVAYYQTVQSLGRHPPSTDGVTSWMRLRSMQLLPYICGHVRTQASPIGL